MTLAKALAIACCAAAWFALALQYYDTETVLGTGPLVLALASLTAWRSWRDRQWLLVAMASMHIGMTLFMFGLVVTLDWSPDDAKQPFFWMTRAYVVGWTLALAHVLFGYTRLKRQVTWGDAVRRVPDKS